MTLDKLRHAIIDIDMFIHLMWQQSVTTKISTLGLHKDHTIVLIYFILHFNGQEPICKNHILSYRANKHYEIARLIITRESINMK